MLNGYGYRLQTQETMTAQVANCIQTALQPRGVAVMIDAAHQYVNQRRQVPLCLYGHNTITGAFQDDADLRDNSTNGSNQIVFREGHDSSAGGQWTTGYHFYTYDT